MNIAWLAFSVALAGAMAGRGLRRRALSRGGAAAAFAVGTCTMGAGPEYGLALIAFYYTSTRWTRWRQELKARLEEGHLAGGQRTAAQVLANSLAGALCALGAATLRAGGGCPPGVAKALGVLDAAFVAFYACCAGDTWASEVGIASSRSPRLLPSLRRVPPGTNGGVSPLGTAASAAGGLTVGACFAAARRYAPAQCSSIRRAAVPLALGGVPLALAAAVVGSLIDSLLGAHLQYSGLDEASGKVVAAPAASGSRRRVRWISGRDVLSNTQVNVAASLGTSAAAAAVAYALL
eukprot:scaffold3.g6457.t1